MAKRAIDMAFGNNIMFDALGNIVCHKSEAMF
jgi:hypothetical protein